MVNVNKVWNKGLKITDILDLELKHNLRNYPAYHFPNVTIMSYPPIIYFILYVDWL